MCWMAAIPYIAMAAGAALQIRGQNQAKQEARRVNELNQRANEQQQALARLMREENAKIGRQKMQSIVDEAQEVTPQRLNLLNKQENVQTQSNVDALRQANVLGDDSVAASAVGNQSESYLQERAKAAAAQTERAVKMARLFGQQNAGATTVANQAQAAIDHRINQNSLDGKRRNINNGYDWLFQNLENERAKINASYNPNKGQSSQAIGGLLMSIGSSGMGSAHGAAAGGRAGNAFISGR